MPHSPKGNLPILFFEDQPAWEAWLKVHYADPQGIWLKIAKKGSRISSIKYDQAVEGALCYGWIDSQAAALDSSFYLQKFSPRRAKSQWSVTNREKAEALITTGRMHPAGLKQVELARADGRWKAAYDPQSRIKPPED